MISPRRWVANRLNRWARRRHGVQTSPLTLRNNRIYIMPSRSGLVFSMMLLVMLLGSMNYNNSMGLGLAFLLGSIMLVAMHHCHRNLLGLQVHFEPPEPVFAGQNASLNVTLYNADRLGRSDLTVTGSAGSEPAVNVASQQGKTVTLSVATSKRGYHTVPRLNIRTRYPGGLFRAWTWVYWDMRVLAYPQPRGDQSIPLHGQGKDAGTKARTQGDEELAELRSYQRGDPLNRVAWKQFARSGELHSKTFDDSLSADLWLDWHSVETVDVEARLEQLAAWVVHIHGQGTSFGLKLPMVTIEPDHSDEHLTRCLTALAIYA